MTRSAAILLAVCLAAPAHAGDPAWPQVNGPSGNFTPRHDDSKFVDDVAEEDFFLLAFTKPPICCC